MNQADQSRQIAELARQLVAAKRLAVSKMRIISAMGREHANEVNQLQRQIVVLRNELAEAMAGKVDRMANEIEVEAEILATEYGTNPDAGQ